MKEYNYDIKGMTNSIKMNRHKIRKNLPTVIVISLLSVLISNAVGIPTLFESVYAIEEFDIDVDVEDNEIRRGDTQHITVTAFNDDTDNRVSDADVRLTVYPPDSDSTSAEDETDNDGEATFDVEIDDNAETGTYDMDVRVSKDGYDTKTVSTSFDVVGSGNDNNDDNHDNNGDDDGNGSSSSAAASASSGNSGSGTSNSAASSASSSNDDDGSGSSSSSSSAAAAADAAAAAAASSSDDENDDNDDSSSSAASTSD